MLTARRAIEARSKVNPPYGKRLDLQRSGWHRSGVTTGSVKGAA